MDFGSIIDLLQESLFVIVVFMLFLSYAMAKGRQALINLIMSLYLALFLALNFPFMESIISSIDSARGQSVLMLLVFGVFTVFSYFLFGRLMPREWDETAFEGFTKKVAFALAGTILIMAFSYHALPITEFVNPGSPIQSAFGSENSFFWWLLVPLVILFFL